ncbi:MAG: Zn-dependent hydrolase [Lachnospiraceae bacterium]
MYTCNTSRMEDLLRTFSTYGATKGGGITRYALSAAALDARREFIRRMQEIGAVIEFDDLACVYATLPGTDPKSKRIVMGSHIDSVKNGGNYDGILGVLAAMEVLTVIASEEIPHTHPITAMIWTNEEGALYPPSMMSSGLICYDYLPDEIKISYNYDNLMNTPGIEYPEQSFGQALAASGMQGVREHRISPANSMCMFELHIEQGPILENAGNDIGVVDCILGLFNCKVKFYGQAAHSGTFPMEQRKDAFYAASQALCWLHDAIDQLAIDGLVYTTGEVHVHPNVHTCVPDYAEFSFDARHTGVKERKMIYNLLLSIAERAWAGCRCVVEHAWTHNTVFLNPDMVEYITQTVKESGISYQPIHSGAGHDAQFCSYMLPTGMIFVPSQKGLSHCEEEYTSLEQCTNGASVMLGAVLKAEESYSLSTNF